MVYSVLKKALLLLWVGLLKLQVVIVAITFALCLALVLIEIFFRYLVGLRLYGFEELASAIIVWTYLIGAAYATYAGVHLKAELAHLVIKTPRGQAIKAAVVSVISLGLVSYILTWSYDYFFWNLAKGEILHLGQVLGDVPMIYSSGALFVGFNLIVFYLLVESIKNVRAVFQK